MAFSNLKFAVKSVKNNFKMKRIKIFHFIIHYYMKGYTCVIASFEAFDQRRTCYNSRIP